MTCTVRYAVGGCCGKPAVHTFVASTGEIFAECAEHFAGAAPAAPTTPAIPVGAIVGVTHVGVAKTGRVVEVGRTRVHVEVPIGRGATATTKVIVRRIEEVRI